MTRPDNVFDRPCIAVDLDGTLWPEQRAGVVPPRIFRERAERLAELRNEGWAIVAHTARPVSAYRHTALDLEAHGIVVDAVVYGKPNADLFLDDRGLLLPPDAMEELARLRWERHEYGMAAWDVYAMGGKATPFRERLHHVGENPDAAPDAAHPGFRIVIPLTGGLDSVTCHEMAKELELPIAAFYVDWGQPFAQQEIAAARRFGDVKVIDHRIEWPTTYQHVQVGRNPAFQRLVLHMAQATGYWGELWTGMHGDEAKLSVGDKSYRFNVTMQHVVSAEGFDFTIQHPLGGMTKVDCVTWFASRGRLDDALRTRTCFNAGDEHCGACWACFQRWSAFGAAGYEAEHRDTMPVIDFTEEIAEYRRKAATRTRAGRDARVIKYIEEKL